MIRIEGVSKIYNEGTAQAFEALKSINMKVNKGELIILSGVSGSGKSTLLHALSTLLKPDSGEIRLFGEDIYQLKERELVRM